MEPNYLGTTASPLNTVSESDRLLSILSHVLTFFTWIFGPLVIYLLKQDESLFVRDHARESLNFQLTLIVAYIAAGLLVILLVGIFLFGGQTLKFFALALIVGFVLGAYSSIFVASTLLAWWRNRKGKKAIVSDLRASE